eukprot:5489671-Pyramimonas_sp.AAC.1
MHLERLSLQSSLLALSLSLVNAIADAHAALPCARANVTPSFLPDALGCHATCFGNSSLLFYYAEHTTMPLTALPTP